MRPKVYIVGGDRSIERMFMNNDWIVVDHPDDADLIQFTGGSDVSPMLYGEPRHPRTGINPERDSKEADVFFHCLDKPKAGICRGGQFLNVMSGGKMYQDVDRHAIAGVHMATLFPEDSFSKRIAVTSTHHQMMRPSAEGEVLMLAELSTFKEDGWGRNVIEDGDGRPDVESVFYNHTLSFCYQPHPEYVDSEHECQVAYFDLIEDVFDLTAKKG